jgi:hypothetical protein
LLPESKKKKTSLLSIEPKCLGDCPTPLPDQYLAKEKAQLKADPSVLPLPFDGYFEMGCYTDNTPEERITYAPKGQAVSPKQCFNFCRDKIQARFFGLTLGRQCYCTPYPTLGGGEGGCTRACEGDKNFMCGGDSMSTVYEMHRCGDVTEVATKDKEAAIETIAAVDFFTDRCGGIVKALTLAAQSCHSTDVRQRVNSLASTLEGLKKSTVAARNDAHDKLTPLTTALSSFNSAAATADMMRAVEEAQADLLGFIAVLEDSQEKLKEYWNEHSLDNAMAFRSIDSLALGSEQKLKADIPDEFLWLPKKVRNDLHGRQYFSEFSYLVVGKETLATLFQVYNKENPIEGRPTGLSQYQWRKWTSLQCHQMCVMTPGCVAGNVVGAAEDSWTYYGSVCNLKADVEKVHLSWDDEKPSSVALAGFVFSSYANLRGDKIEFNTANCVVPDDAEGRRRRRRRYW